MLALGTVTGDSVAPGSAVICGRVLIVNAHDPRHKFVVTTAGRPVRRFACPYPRKCPRICSRTRASGPEALAPRSGQEVGAE